MSSWKPTPFETLEDAHKVATKLGLNPCAFIPTDDLRYFQTKTGRQRSIIAQKLEGGPVLEKRLPKGKKSERPLQDPNAPSFGQEDRLLTGPWIDSDHATLDAVRAHYQQLGPSTKHKLGFEGPVLVVEYPDKDVVEYRFEGNRVQQRALMSAKGRYLTPYEDPKKAEFNASAWDVCEYQDVEGHWREQFINFDNVEALEVTLYRIGMDEYEYVSDKNTGEVWCRKLSVVKKAH